MKMEARLFCKDFDHPWKSSIFVEENEMEASDLKTGFSQAIIGGLIEIEEILSKKDQSSTGKVILTQRGFDAWREEREFQYKHHINMVRFGQEKVYDRKQDHIKKKYREMEKEFKQNRERHQR